MPLVYINEWGNLRSAANTETIPRIFSLIEVLLHSAVGTNHVS